MDSYLASPLIFLVSVAFGFYTLLILLRFILQLLRADFYNPVSQLIISLTTPLLKPLRKLIPGYRGMDMASLAAAWLIKSIETFLVLMLSGFQGAIFGAFLWSLPQLLELAFYIFIFSIFIDAILSWFPSTAGHPLRAIAATIGRPVLSLTRRLLPTPASGIDLSPMVATIGLILIKMLVMPPLYVLFAMPKALF